MSDPHKHPDQPDNLVSTLNRRRFIKTAAAGAVIAALGGYYFIDNAATRAARKQTRPDGRPRLPPGQEVISELRKMGGEPGDPNPRNWSLYIHGDVDRPTTLDFDQLLSLPQADITCDVHCVTAWSCLDTLWQGVLIKTLADLVGVRPEARHLIFESDHGYTANVPLAEALAPTCLLAHSLNSAPLASPHGGPVRAVIPDLYFWKSAKWVVGLRFSHLDAPGFWEVRGYHNHADPWKEERYS
jgi:DMSO/TMAO reductase YedYZ molybdopterin-dependent catalytic subunit